MDLKSYNLLVKKIHNAIKKEFSAKRYNNALEMISVCAEIMYNFNYDFRDDFLEKILDDIGKVILKEKENCNKSDIILIYDGFGFDTRGLIRIYLDAAIQHSKVVYVTYKDRKEFIPGILKKVLQSKNEVVFVDRKEKLSAIANLNAVIENAKPTNIIMYTTPWDVIGVTVMNTYKNIVTIYQINLTDHTFWLGVNSFEKCVEFRNFGTYISKKYRKIDADCLVVLPYYAASLDEYEFEGYPFEYDETLQQIIFSGGALKKTFGDDDKYYHIVDELLACNKNVIFWYAGSGDESKIRKLKKKYPKRVYITKERKDIMNVLRKSTIYLNTYPVSGGLMLQYAAMAGIVPISLKHDDDIYGVLEKNIQRELTFDSVESLLEEANRLLRDKEYRKEKEKKLIRAVIREEEFNTQFSKMMNEKITDYEIDLTPIDIVPFQEAHEENRKYCKQCYIIARSKIFAWIKYLPLEFLVGCILRLNELRRKAVEKLLIKRG